MTYRLEFHERALTEWKALDASVRQRLKDKLTERLAEPRIPSARIARNRYKIKIKAPGFRLVYVVEGDVIRVLAVGPRDRIYAAVASRE